MSFSRIRCFGESENTTAKSLMTCSLIRSSVPASFCLGKQLAQAGPPVIAAGLGSWESGDFGVELFDRVGRGV